MTRRRLVLMLAALTLAVGSAAPVMAQGYYSPRQYYGSWKQYPSKNYYYRQYYYKPAPTYSGYKHHYVIKPYESQHSYYYNPYKGQYWGRIKTQHDGKPEYSILKPEDRKGSLAEIPEGAFPEPGPLPPLPEAEDDVTLDLPPDDVPGPADAE